MQRRIWPILQKVISLHQSAFLSGRNIHHNLLLVSEMLHGAQTSGEEYILLKLDVCKAFYRLEWPFILASVDKARMAGKLWVFLRGGSALPPPLFCWTVGPHRLSRCRVRQGCPISPLIFILALDALSLLRSDIVQRKTLVGVEFWEQARSEHCAGLLRSWCCDADISKNEICTWMSQNSWVVWECFWSALYLGPDQGGLSLRARHQCAFGFCRGSGNLSGKRTQIPWICLDFLLQVISPLLYCRRRFNLRLTWSWVNWS